MAPSHTYGGHKCLNARTKPTLLASASTAVCRDAKAPLRTQCNCSGTPFGPNNTMMWQTDQHGWRPCTQHVKKMADKSHTPTLPIQAVMADAEHAHNGQMDFQRKIDTNSN